MDDQPNPLVHSQQAPSATGAWLHVLAEPAAPQHHAELTRLSVLIPIYNERWTLAEILRRVLDTKLPLDLEVVAVDDASTDGSWELLQEIAAREPRIRTVRHPQNRGKGAAIRTAVAHMSGDVAVVQDADLEYDPSEYAALLEPLLDGRADAVFGSRYAGTNRRVQRYWHTQVNQCLTLLSNMLTDLKLTDMETCYKMVRADVLRQLRLTADTFTLEPELTARLAQWGARIYEVPISYSARSFQEGKKIRPRDAVKAILQMLRCAVVDRRFTDDRVLDAQSAQQDSARFHRGLVDAARPFLGRRVLEVGAGLGVRSQWLLGAEQLVLIEPHPHCARQLAARFSARANVVVADQRLAERWMSGRDGPTAASCLATEAASHADFTQPGQHLSGEAVETTFDTVFCTDVLDRAEDERGLIGRIAASLAPGGHAIFLVAAQPPRGISNSDLHANPRRYDEATLCTWLRAAGLEVVENRAVGRVAGVGGSCWRALVGGEPSPRAAARLARLVPWTSWLDRWLPFNGHWLWVVARRPSAAAVRQAA